MMNKHRLHMGGITEADTSLAGQRGSGRLVIPGIIALALSLAVGYSFLVSDGGKDATGDAAVRTVTPAQTLPEGR
ncbi:MAG: hypothetical protein QHC67_01390 [Sphingobium sp.]|uniref:hypothetical protein n=1 Tax=Sphingobium sp. TaxID=1912891 RepID=UPI0029A1644D|nr:hypothetical protein [Sphingobium sp.]MDX3908461.1 hypothetical protein [Sphingobium sp.]